MHLDYNKILAWVRGTAASLAGFVFVTIAGGFILQLFVGADWYEHPWATVASVIGFVEWLVTNSMFHWLGGAAIGFAVGIWLDDTLRRLAAEPPAPNARPMPAKGFLDYQMDLIRSTGELAKVLGTASMNTASLGQYMAKQTPKIGRLTQNIQAGKSPERMLQNAHKIAAKMGAYMDAYCVRITEADAKFSGIADTMIAAVDWLAVHQDSYRSQNTAALDSLRLACSGARDGLGRFIVGLDGLHGVEASLNQSCDRTMDLINHFLTTTGRIESLCERIIAGPTITTDATPSPLLPPNTEGSTPQ